MDMKSNTRRLTITALLMAIAIIIPIVMPIRVVIGPASFTLASHVPIMIWPSFFRPVLRSLYRWEQRSAFLLPASH